MKQLLTDIYVQNFTKQEILITLLQIKVQNNKLLLKNISNRKFCSLNVRNVFQYKTLHWVKILNLFTKIFSGLLLKFQYIALLLKLFIIFTKKLFTVSALQKFFFQVAANWIWEPKITHTREMWKRQFSRDKSWNRF